MTRGTLVLAALGYLAVVFSPVAKNFLNADPPLIVSGQLWRLVTYPLVVVGIFNALFGLYFLWSFGSELESYWGSRSYALFLLLVTFCAGALGTGTAFFLGPKGLAAPTYGGLSGLATALIVAWMLIGPDLPTNLLGILPMTRKGFALIAIIFVVLGEIEQTHSLVRLVFGLGGLPLAWFWTRRGRPLSGPRGNPFPRFFRRRRLRVVRDDDSGRFH